MTRFRRFLRNIKADLLPFGVVYLIVNLAAYLLPLGPLRESLETLKVTSMFCTILIIVGGTLPLIDRRKRAK